MKILEADLNSREQSVSDCILISHTCRRIIESCHVHLNPIPPPRSLFNATFSDFSIFSPCSFLLVPCSYFIPPPPMLGKRASLLLLGLFALATTCSYASEESLSEDQAVENLAVFSRVYGYVRFFHPSDQAVIVDWDKVGILGAEQVRDARDREALRAALLQVFQPIAPRMRLESSVSEADAAAKLASAFTSEQNTFWQYLGVRLSGLSVLYKQQRAISGPDSELKTNLFEPAKVAPVFIKELAPGLVLSLPQSLPVLSNRKTVDAESPAFEALQAKLATIDPKALTPTDWRLRVADVVIVWNVFQHFHPYLDLIGVEWEKELRPALRRALRDRNAEDLYATLSELVAKSKDGHGYIYDRPPGTGVFPMRVAVVEGKLVVTGAAKDTPFRKGDIIEKVDGIPALELLLEREHYVAGSPQLRRFRALNQFGLGRAGSFAHFEVVRDGRNEKIEYTRTPDPRGYYFNPIGEFEFPGFAELRPGVFYVNLYAFDVPAFEEKVPLLAKAKGIIFDWRWDGRFREGKKLKMLQPSADIIPHLIDKRIHASPMLTPQISAPDRVGWTYLESTWPVDPKSPRFPGRIVFINEPSVVSYGETCMAMIADYHLATLVGAPTAGCNGNANYILLPGGFRVMWTGMDVRKHDHTPFYNVGFEPDAPVVRTVQAVKEGRDEYLEKAIEVIEKSESK